MNYIQQAQKQKSQETAILTALIVCATPIDTSCWCTCPKKESQN